MGAEVYGIVDERDPENTIEASKYDLAMYIQVRENWLFSLMESAGWDGLAWGAH